MKVIRFKIKSFFLSALIVMLPVFAIADELTDVVNDVAAKLVQQLPMDKKIALKSLSPDETGLPEDFLRKLTSDLEAALLTVSDFEINLANRASMEDVWQEAVEFNNADFDELFKSANADVMLMLSPRAISTGVEIAITAYSLTGDDVGKTLASSGSVLLPIDLQANLGVDVNDLNKQMAQVLAEIEKVGQTGGLISNPNTYVDYYHNARILQQRGEIDLALKNYLEVLRNSALPFVDPIDDMFELAVAVYGTNSTKFIEKKALPLIQNEHLREYLKWKLFPSFDSITNEAFQDIAIFPPVLFQWLDQHKTTLEEAVRKSDANQATDYKALHLLLEGARLASHWKKTGEIQKYYIDKFRVREYFDQAQLDNLIAEFNRAEFKYFTTSYEHNSGAKYLDYQSAINNRTDAYFVDEEWGILGASRFNVPIFDGSAQNFKDSVRELKPNFQTIDFSAMFLKSDMSYSDELLGPCALSFDGAEASNRRLKEIESYSISPVKENEQSDLVRSHQMRPAYDRLIFADLCLEARTQYEPYQFMEGSFKYGLFPGETYQTLEGPEFGTLKNNFGVVSGISDILITDNVDLDKPIVLHLGFQTHFSRTGMPNPDLNYIAVDITKDGTFIPRQDVFDYSGHEKYFDPDGVTIAGSFGNWLRIPSIIQSSVGIETIHVGRIDYTNVYGEKKSVTNISKAALGNLGIFNFENSFGGYGIQGYSLDEASECVYEEILPGNPCTSGASTSLISDYTVIRDYYFHSQSNSEKVILISAEGIVDQIEYIFRQEPKNNRVIFQNGLKTLGFYKSKIDGSWGKGTRAAFIKLFEYLDTYHTDRKYVSDYGFSENDITRAEFVDFWNGMYSCDTGKLLSITSACGN